jgi:hypothetical protein
MVGEPETAWRMPDPPPAGVLAVRAAWGLWDRYDEMGRTWRRGEQLQSWRSLIFESTWVTAYGNRMSWRIPHSPSNDVFSVRSASGTEWLRHSYSGKDWITPDERLIGWDTLLFDHDHLTVARWRTWHE